MPARFAALCLIVLLSACALRPRYAPLVNAAPVGSESVDLELVTQSTGVPIANAVIVVGDGRWRQSTKTDAAGRFALRVESQLVRANPVVEVQLPKHVREGAYVIRPVSQPPPARTDVPTPVGVTP